MSSQSYTNGKEQIAKQSLDWRTATIRVMLVTPDYVFNAVHDYLSEITDELSGTGYARQTLQGTTISRNGEDMRFDAEDVSWASLDADNGNLGAAIIYAQIGGDDSTPEDDILICYLDLLDQPTTGAPVNIIWSVDGLLDF